MNKTLPLNHSIFDTNLTQGFSLIKTKQKFVLRNYVDREGKSIIYLIISDKKNRVRINTGISVNKKYWDEKKQRIKQSTESNKNNLLLDNIESRLTTIKISYALQNRFLSSDNLASEFQTSSPEFDFIAFFKHHLELQPYKKQTIKNHRSVLKKLRNFSKEIPFHEITSDLFLKYRKFYSKNSEITYNSDLKCIKVYLNIAHKKGIKLGIRPDEIKVNVESNKTVYLEPFEMKKIIKYYYNQLEIGGEIVPIKESHILPLGYFLFSCYTGLRISDIQNKSREEIIGEKFNFSSIKTDRQQYMRLNSEARKMVNFCKELFIKKISDQKINLHLKNIASICEINKNITMHVGRHTFATTFMRNNGDVYRLKILLGHAKIEHTQKYVHLVNEEVLDDIDLISFS